MIIPMRVIPNHEEAIGYVTFPSSLIECSKLKDFDVRLLLLLDQIGWREGARDGIIRITNEEMSARLGKDISSIRRSLTRIEAVKPALIVREMVTHKTRQSIRLVYDRFGGACWDRPTILADSDEVVQASDRQKCPSSPQMIGKNAYPDRQKCPSLPIRELEIPEPEDAREDGQKCLSSHQITQSHAVGHNLPIVKAGPKTALDLISWLPAVSRDDLVIANFTVMIPLWFERVKARRPEFASVAHEWVQDAIEKSCLKQDPVPYADAVLSGFIKKGGRKGIELPDDFPGRTAGKAASTPNLPPEGSTESLLASRRSEDAQVASRERRWKSLSDSERRSIEAAFDRDNPRPSDQLPKFWATIRLRGCQELMDRTKPPHREAQ